VTAADAEIDPAMEAARAAVIAEIDARGGGVAPSLRPLTLNTGQPLYPPSAALAAKLEARIAAGFEPEGGTYPTSGTWMRVVVPALAVATVDVPVVITTGILAALHIQYTLWLFIASVLVLVGAVAVAAISSIPPLRDPLRLTTNERRELNQARSWQSRQSWMGPRASTPEYRLTLVAHDTVHRLAESPAWGSRFLDEHRVRLNLAQELDGIDYQAAQLASLREVRGRQEPGHAQAESAWSALLDRVARLRHYADGVRALDVYAAQLGASTGGPQLEAHLGALAVGSALDEFAAAHVQLLSQDLARLTATMPATSSAPSPRSAR
jgi:hypothetical protein